MDKLGQTEMRIEDAHGAGNMEEVDAFDILLILALRRRMIGIVTLSALLIGVLLAVFLKPIFTASAIILPPQQQSPSSSLLGQLGSIASLGGGASALSLKTPADMYVGILGSRTIADQIISQFRLQDIYKERKMEDARKVLKSNTEFEDGKDSLIHIIVTDHDPRRASDIANAYVDLLYGMNSKLAITEAAQRRVFFDQQLDSEKKALTAAEDELRATEQKTGLIQLSGQAQVVIQSIAQLRAQIASREVELQSVRVSSTEMNPNVVRLQQEIVAMQQQLSKLEDDSQRQPGDISLPAGRVPQDSLEFARKYREVKYHETLYDLLSRQYEAARIDEAKSAPIIQVIDRAAPPDKKSGPRRSLILAGSVAVGFILGCIWAFLGQAWFFVKGRPASAEKLAKIQNALRITIE